MRCKNELEPRQRAERTPRQLLAPLCEPMPNITMFDNGARCMRVSIVAVAASRARLGSCGGNSNRQRAGKGCPADVPDSESIQPILSVLCAPFVIFVVKSDASIKPARR
jgi:hypothetical protein